MLPDEIAEPDDKSQAPEGEADDAESGTTPTTRRPDAGQTPRTGRRSRPPDGSPIEQCGPRDPDAGPRGPHCVVHRLARRGGGAAAPLSSDGAHGPRGSTPRCWRCSRAWSRGDSSIDAGGSSRTTSSASCAGATWSGCTTASSSTTPATPRGCSAPGPASLLALAGRARATTVRAPGGRRPGRSGRDDSRRSTSPSTADRRSRCRPATACTGSRGFDDKVQWNTSRPAVRIEEALDRRRGARGRTTSTPSPRSPTRSSARGVRPPAASREHLDAARPASRAATSCATCSRTSTRGTCSVLEHGYLTRVERPHGLPDRHARQVRDSRQRAGLPRRRLRRPRARSSSSTAGCGTTASTQRDADLDRDLDAAVGRQGTVRLGWGQVFERPCSTAVASGGLLHGARLGRRPRPVPGLPAGPAAGGLIRQCGPSMVRRVGPRGPRLRRTQPQAGAGGRGRARRRSASRARRRSARRGRTYAAPRRRRRACGVRTGSGRRRRGGAGRRRSLDR